MHPNPSTQVSFIILQEAVAQMRPRGRPDLTTGGVSRDRKEVILIASSHKDPAQQQEITTVSPLALRMRRTASVGLKPSRPSLPLRLE